MFGCFDSEGNQRHDGLGEIPDGSVRGLVDITTHFNETRQGCAGNVTAAITRALDATGAPWFLVVEEDWLLAPDALELAEWMQLNVVDYDNDVSTFSLYQHPDNSEHIDAVMPNPWFTCKCWGTKSETWRDFMDVFDPSVQPFSSWAVPFNIWRHYGGCEPLAVQPVLSRCQYIGRHGTFTTAADFADIVCDHWSGDGRDDSGAPYWLMPWLEVEPEIEPRLLEKFSKCFPGVTYEELAR
jgi:hypothetical protein